MFSWRSSFSFMQEWQSVEVGCCNAINLCHTSPPFLFVGGRDVMQSKYQASLVKNSLHPTLFPADLISRRKRETHDKLDLPDICPDLVAATSRVRWRLFLTQLLFA